MVIPHTPQSRARASMDEIEDNHIDDVNYPSHLFITTKLDDFQLQEFRKHMQMPHKFYHTREQFVNALIEYRNLFYLPHLAKQDDDNDEDYQRENSEDADWV